jgi:hypothetical protein
MNGHTTGASVSECARAGSGGDHVSHSTEYPSVIFGGWRKLKETLRQNMKPDSFAREIMTSIQYAFEAHCVHPKSPIHATRAWDRSTPGIIHPIWCAMTLLSETRLSADIRRVGYRALLWHDVLEDTKLGLPNDSPNEIKTLIDELTFASFTDERRDIWNRSDLAKLLKLYDKTSNLLDGSWMMLDQRRIYIDHTTKLAEFVRTVYGDLNIVKLAEAVCNNRGDGEGSDDHLGNRVRQSQQ